MDSYKIDEVSKLKKTIFSTDNMKKLINKLELVTKTKLNKFELSNFLNYIKDYNYTKIYKSNKNDIDTINNNFIKYYLADLGKLQSPFDIHDYLKKEINNKASIVGTTDYKFSQYQSKSLSSNQPTQQVQQVQQSQNNNIFSTTGSKKEQIELTKILNYQSLWRDSNLLIDSRYQSIANNDSSKIVFNIVSNTKIKTPGSGVITSIGNIKDIVEIEIFPFSIPYLSSADNYYQKITLSILELSAISIDAYEDSQFHFIFQTKTNGNLIDLIPINKVFRFFKPISKISDFSLRFGSPLSPIVFDKDRLRTTNINYSSNPGVITFGDAHNLITGDLVYIEDFATLTPAIDLNIVNEINNSQGHICTRLNNTSISINVDFTQIQNPNLSLSVLIYFGSKRILVPIKFRYLIGENE